MNYNITPFLTYVRAEYLGDIKEGTEYFLPATVFGISGFSDKPLSLQLLVDDKKIYNDIPIAAIANSKTAPKINVESCFSSLINSENINIIVFDFLANITTCLVLKQDNSPWQNGSYLFSIENVNNEQLHLIELNDGNYIFWENNLLTWNTAENENQ